MITAFTPRSACPVCGAASYTSIFTRPYAEPRLRAALTNFYTQVGGLDYSVLLDADYSLARCGNCGLVFQVNVPNDTLLGRLYEEWIDPQQAYARFHYNPPPHRRAELKREVTIAISFLSLSAPRLALDYGCGWGEWSQMTQTCGFEAWGTELSATRRAHAEKSGIRIEVDDQLPNHAFSLINLDQVLEHVPHPRETLALLASKLHPRGVLRVAVPNGLRVAHALRHFDRELTLPRLGGINPVAPLEHLNCFTFNPLIRLAQSCGLQRVRPSWAILMQSLVFPPGCGPRLKALLRPFYLRSRLTTQLYFRKLDTTEPNS
jgi:transcription elongation factor Elf1